MIGRLSSKKKYRTKLYIVTFILIIKIQLGEEMYTYEGYVMQREEIYAYDPQMSNRCLNEANSTSKLFYGLITHGKINKAWI